jgi:hypothetical protein
VGNGVCTLFWLDPWIDGQGITERALELLAIVDKRKHGSQMVQEAMHDNVCIRDTMRAFTILA